MPMEQRGLGLSTFDPIDKARVLVVGDSGVGKTSLVHLLCKGEVLKSPVHTVGCAVDVKVHEYPRTKRSYFVEFLDISGSSKQRASRSILYANVNALILVHDITNRKSYQNLWKWVAEVFGSAHFKSPNESGSSRDLRDHGHLDFDIDVRVGEIPPSIPILVVGTKADLASDARERRRSSIAEEYGGDCINMSTQQQVAYSPALERIYNFLTAVIDAKVHPTISPLSGSHSLTSSYSASNVNRSLGGGFGGGGSMSLAPGVTGSMTSSGPGIGLPTITPEMQRRRMPQTGLYGGRSVSPSKSLSQGLESWKSRSVADVNSKNKGIR